MAQRLTNLDVFVLAMDDAADENGEFWEWAVTVAAWQRDPARYGLRGYEHLYPDHKNVATQDMSRTTGAIGKGFMEKVSANRYRITSLGRRRANFLSGSASESGEKGNDSARLDMSFETASFDRLETALQSPAFVYYTANSSVHPNWNFTASLLKISQSDDRASTSEINLLVQTINEALTFESCRKEGVVRRSAASEYAITEMSLVSLLKLVSESINFWKEDLEILGIPIDRLLSEIESVMKQHEESKV